MISEGKRSTPPYDIDEKIVKEAICEIYGKHIIRNPSVEFRVEDRVGASQIFPTVTCKLFTCTSLTYHCNEEDANKQIDPVSLMLLKDFQRKVVKEVKSTTLQIEFGRIHNIVKAKFSPEKIAEMIKEILHDKRGAISGKKTGILEGQTREDKDELYRENLDRVGNVYYWEDGGWHGKIIVRRVDKNKVYYSSFLEKSDQGNWAYPEYEKAGNGCLIKKAEMSDTHFQFNAKTMRQFRFLKSVKGMLLSKKVGIIEKNDNMKIVKNFTEFLAESSQEKCSVCGKPVEQKAEYADICLSCEEKGYWEDPSGGVHSPDENDPAAMYETEKYDGKSSLKKGTVLKTGRFGQFKLEVIEDDGEELVLKNLNKNYRKDPFRRLKTDYKGAFIVESLEESKKEIGILPEHYSYAAKLMAIRNLAMEHHLSAVKKLEDLDYAWERTRNDVESETGESITPELNDWLKEVKKGAKNPKSYVSEEWNKFLHSIRGSVISKETGIS